MNILSYLKICTLAHQSIDLRPIFFPPNMNMLMGFSPDTSCLNSTFMQQNKGLRDMGSEI